MPLNGGGTASKPAGTTAAPNSTIASAPFNSVIDDIYAIFNTPRPIVYGGTNGTSAVEGGDNLSTKGADIPSATTTNIGAATGRFVHITGTTTITGLGTTTAGVARVVVFDGILTLTHNATSLILPDATNITTAAGDVAIFVSEGAGNWRCINYQRAVTTAASYAPPFYVSGLAASTNSGSPSTHIDISPGYAASSSSPFYLIQLVSSVTKNTAGSWAVGTGNGSLDTGAIANSQYYGYLIQRSDTGVVDVLTSLSSTAPTMPANYDRRSPPLFTFTRVAGVNTYPTPGIIGLQPITLGTSVTAAHGLGVEPSFVAVELICTTTDLGYAVGKKVQAASWGLSVAGTGHVGGFQIDKDSTNVIIRYPASFVYLWSITANNGSFSAITPANWRVIVRPYR